MDVEQLKLYLEMLNRLLTVIGDVTISEAKTWVDVKLNADDLAEETKDPE